MDGVFVCAIWLCVNTGRECVWFFVVDPRVIETRIITGAPKNRWSLLVCVCATDGAEISAENYMGVSCGGFVCVTDGVLLTVPKDRQGPNARSCTPKGKGRASGVVDCNGRKKWGGMKSSAKLRWPR